MNKQRWLSFMLLPIMLIGLALVAYFGPWLKIVSTDCHLGSRPCPAIVTQAITAYRGQFAPFIAIDRLQTALFLALPTATDVTVSVILPDRLMVMATEAVPLINLKRGASPTLFTLGTNHRLLGVAPDTSPLPVLTLHEPLDLYTGLFITDPSLLATTSLLEMLSQRGLVYTAAVVDSPDQVVVTLESGLTVIFSSNHSIPRQVTALQQVLPTATMNPSLSVIDVRLDKPVLKPKVSAGGV